MFIKYYTVAILFTTTTTNQRKLFNVLLTQKFGCLFVWLMRQCHLTKTARVLYNQF